MKLSKSAAAIFAVALAVAAPMVALADTIRLRDGSVVRGQIIAYKDQQFTVLLGAGARGRRSRMTIYMEDIESIEFDNPLGAPDTGDGGSAANPRGGEEATYDAGNDNAARQQPQRTTTTQQPPAATTRPAPQPQRAANARTDSAPVFFPIQVRVDPKSSESGWVSSGFSVRRGQRVRISATGRVTLSNGTATTPTGLPRVADTDKLLASEPTGALIAVVGDDNNDFILVSSQREFTAARDGIIFLGINTGRLSASAGAFDVVIEPEAISSR